MPQISNIHDLTVAVQGVSVAPAPNTLVADEIFPPFDTDLKAAAIERIDADSYSKLQVSVRRAAGGSLNYGDFQIDKNITYNCWDHNWASVVPHEDFAPNTPSSYRAIVDKTKYCITTLQNNREFEVMALLTANLTGATRTGTPTVKWNNTSGKPVKDTRAYIQALQDACGLIITDGVFPARVVNAFAASSEGYDLIKYSAEPGYAKYSEMLASILGLERVHITKLDGKRSSKKGQALTLSNIWGENVLLYARANPQLQTNGLGLRPVWRAGENALGGTNQDGFLIRIKEDAVEPKTVVSAHNYYDLCAINWDAGFLVTNTLE